MVRSSAQRATSHTCGAARAPSQNWGGPVKAELVGGGGGGEGAWQARGAGRAEARVRGSSGPP